MAGKPVVAGEMDDVWGTCVRLYDLVITLTEC